MKKSKKQQTAGFTLLEALFASILIGLVIAALAASSGAYTMANGYGVDLSTAEFLTEAIREWTISPEFVPDFDTLLTKDGVTFSPPIDTDGANLTDFSEFTQQIAVDYVQPGNLTQVSASATDFVRVTVTITRNSRPLSTTSWIRARLD